MAKYAVVESGVVTNIILIDDTSTYPYPVVAVPDGIQIGATYDGTVFTNPPTTIPAPSPTLPKSTVMARVIAANKMSEAQNALWANPPQFAQWFAPDKPDIACDDAATIAFIQALGLDPNVILAP